MASVPEKTKKKKEPKSDIELLEWSDDRETFTAEIFGEETFTFSTDVNAFLLLNAIRDGGGFVDLMDSLVEVEEVDDEDIEDTRRKEQDRFHSLLSRQKKLSVERLAQFVGDITEIAGNEDAETSSSD